MTSLYNFLHTAEKALVLNECQCHKQLHHKEWQQAPELDLAYRHWRFCIALEHNRLALKARPSKAASPEINQIKVWISRSRSITYSL